MIGWNGDRPPSRPGRGAIVFSLLTHALLVGGFWATGLATRAPELPEFRTYRVNIVSPPPLERGPPEAISLSANTRVQPPTETPQPTPQPVTPPPVTPPPQQRPEPTPTPRTQPAPTPAAQTPPRPAQTQAPAPTTPPRQTAAATPPRQTTPAPAPSVPTTGATTNQPTATPPRGANPNPNTRVAGDGLNVRIEGEEFPFPGYMDNIIRQISRYFRWNGQSGLSAEIYFVIMRDGSVQMSDTRWIRRSGTTGFDFAALEAIEQAGRAQAFGPLPGEFRSDRLAISFYFEPAR